MELALPSGIPENYLHGFNLIFAVIIAIGIIFLGFSLMKVKKSQDFSEYFLKIRRAYGFFLIFYGICRIFFILGVQFPNEISRFGHAIPDGYRFLILIGYLFFDMGLLSIIIALEATVVTKTHHAFSILSGITLVIGIIGFVLVTLGMSLPIDFSGITTYYLFPILVGLLVIIYFVIAIRTQANVRTRAIIILLAIVLLGIGAFLDSESNVANAVGWSQGNATVLEIIYCIPPLISFIGGLLFSWVNLKND